jgi:hypothetical protein
MGVTSAHSLLLDQGSFRARYRHDIQMIGGVRSRNVSALGVAILVAFWAAIDVVVEGLRLRPDRTFGDIWEEPGESRVRVCSPAK